MLIISIGFLHKIKKSIFEIIHHRLLMGSFNIWFHWIKISIIPIIRSYLINLILIRLYSSIRSYSNIRCGRIIINIVCDLIITWGLNRGDFVICIDFHRESISWKLNLEFVGFRDEWIFLFNKGYIISDR